MLGSDLAEKFQSAFPTVGIGRSVHPHLTIPYSLCDLTKKELTQQLIQREKPQIVFHAAAMTDVDRCQQRRYDALQNNLEATKNVTDACNRAGALLVFFSTDYVYDGEKQGEYLEDDPPNPRSVYGETKYLAERYIEQRSNRYVIFRTCWLFGFNGRSFPRTIWERAPKQPAFQVVSDQVGRPTYTRDIASALFDLFKKDSTTLEKVSGQIFHLANEGSVSWADFARFILQFTPFEKVPVESISSEQLSRTAPRPLNSVLSLNKLHATFGMTLRPWKEAAAEFLQELKLKGQQPEKVSNHS